MATSPTVEREKRTAFPKDVPARSPYATQGNPIREFGDAASQMASSFPPPARAADGSMAGPGLTPYAPYRMGPQRQPAAQPVSRATAAVPAAAALATPPRAPIPSVGTMPLEQDVQGVSVNPLGGAPSINASGLMQDTRAVLSQSGQEMARLREQGRYGALAGEAARATTALVPALASDVLIRPAAPLVGGAIDAGRQFLGLNDPRSTATQTPASMNPASDQATGGTRAAPASASAPARPATATAAPTTTAPQAASTEPRQIRLGIYETRRPGQSVEFGDAASLNDTGFQNRGAISPQNMRAADMLAARSQAEAQGTIARQQYDAEVAQAQAINAARVGQRSGRISDYLESGMARRALANQNVASTIADRNEQGQSRRAADILAQRRQDESEANSDVTRRTGEVQLTSAQQIQALQSEVLNAQTPEARNAAAKKLAQISGREQQNRYTVIPGGQEFDQAAGAVLTRPAMVLDNSTGRLVNMAGQAGAQPERSPYPDGTRLTGRDGKVYTVQNGQPVLETE